MAFITCQNWLEGHGTLGPDPKLVRGCEVNFASLRNIGKIGALEGGGPECICECSNKERSLVNKEDTQVNKRLDTYTITSSSFYPISCFFFLALASLIFDPLLYPPSPLLAHAHINTLKAMHVSLSQLRAGLWSIVVFTMVSRPFSVGSVSGSGLYCVIYTRAFSFEAPCWLWTWSVHNAQYWNDAFCSHHSIYSVNHKATRKQQGATSPLRLTKDLACSFLFCLVLSISFWMPGQKLAFFSTVFFFFFS